MDWFNPKPIDEQETQTEITTETQTEVTTEVTTEAIPETTTEIITEQETTEVTTETISETTTDFGAYQEEELNDNSFEAGLNGRREEEKEFIDNNVWKPTYDNDGTFWVDESYSSEYNPDYSGDYGYDINTGLTDGTNTVVDNNEISIKDKTEWGLADRTSNGFSSSAEEVSDRLGSQNVVNKMTYKVKTLSTYERGFVQAEPKQLTTLNTLNLPEPVIIKQNMAPPIILFIAAFGLLLYIKISKSLFLKKEKLYIEQKELEASLDDSMYKNIDFDKLYEESLKGDENNEII